MKAASVVLIILGLVSLGTSAIWSKIAPKPPVMSEEKSEAFSKAMGDLHNSPAQEATPEQQAIIEEINEDSRKAESRERIGKAVFRIGGILMSLIGAGIYFWDAKHAA